MTQEFVTLPREVVEYVLKAMGCGGLLKQRQAMVALHAALEQTQVEQEPVAEHELKDVRCECCGYMTHHREHMGCIRAAQPKREPLTDEQKDAARWRHMKQGGCDWWVILGRVRSDLECNLDQAVDDAIQRANNIK